jgi:hypothetical protein
MANDNVIARFTDAQTRLVNGILYESGKLTVMSGESASRNIENFPTWQDGVEAMTATRPPDNAQPMDVLIPLLGAATFPQSEIVDHDPFGLVTDPVPAAPVEEKPKRGRKPKALQTPTPAAVAMASFVSDLVGKQDAPPAPLSPEELTIDAWRTQARDFNVTSEALLRVGLKTRAGLLDDVATCLFKAANLYAVEAGLQPQA